MKPPPRGLAVEDVDLVAERREVAGHGQAGRAGADAGDALAVARLGDRRQQRAHLALVVGGDALEAADRDRLLLDAAAPAGGLAGAVAGAAEDAGEDVGVPVDHVGVGVPAGRDQPDVFRHRRMGGARPLAVHDLVEVVGIGDVGGLHARGSPFRRPSGNGALILRPTAAMPDKSGSVLPAEAGHGSATARCIMCDVLQGTFDSSLPQLCNACNDARSHEIGIMPCQTVAGVLRCVGGAVQQMALRRAGALLSAGWASRGAVPGVRRGAVPARMRAAG